MDSQSRRRYRYCVYGVVILTDLPLALPEYPHAGLGEIECLSAPASFFDDALLGDRIPSRHGCWYHHALLRDGSSYVRWDGVGAFLVAADGRRIHCRREDDATSESFQVYLLGQALSFALVKQRLEPLHATAVLVNGQAVAFLGSSAFGKSSLAACFLAAGCRLITDDLLVLRRSVGGTLVYPGPPRIKLFSAVARHIFGEAATAVPMNGETGKLILPVSADGSCRDPIKLTAIYALAAPRDTCRMQTVRIETLSPRQAFVTLVKGTFNRQHVNRDRLADQFDLMSSLAVQMPVRQLAYPRTIARLHEVRSAVFADLQ